MEGPGTELGLAAGTRFGRFAVVRPMAAGGMSEVYLGVDAEEKDNPSTPIAIKRLLPRMAWDPEYVRMFLDEVRIAASLDHPNIVRVLDYGVGDGGYYFAMEYLHGATVHAILRDTTRQGAIPFEVAGAIVLGAAQGLDYAHGFGVIHRDVSPTNVIVTHDGQTKLVDFGIARMRAETRYTRAGTLKGKMGYMSPEQCRGDNVDPRSDVFGLGILFYELTVGRKAFYGDNDYAVINRIVKGEYRRPTELVPTYPRTLEAIVDRALAVDPARRYPTAAAFADDLRARGFTDGATDVRAFMEGLYGRPSLPALDVPIPAPARNAGRLRTVALVVGAVVLGVGGYALGSGLDDAAPAVQVIQSPAPTELPAATAVESKPAVVAQPAPDREEPVAAETGEAAPEDEARSESTRRSAKRRGRSGRAPAKQRKSVAAEDTPGDALLPPSWKD
jgi:serine/threonine-protein kinase